MPISLGWRDPMNNSRISALIALSISPSQVRPDGTLTRPRSFGVYRLTGAAHQGRLYRFGNHPIRQHELVNQYGSATLESLFFERKLAEELASLLNHRAG